MLLRLALPALASPTSDDASQYVLCPAAAPLSLPQVAAGEVRVERLEEDAAVVDHSGDPLWVLHGAEEETVPLSAVRRTLQASWGKAPSRGLA